MFAAIYRWRIKPGSEDAFRRHWVRGTEILRSTCGAWGSRLHRSEDGTMIAYAHWPSKADRDRVWHNLPADAKREVAAMRSCVEEFLPEIGLTVTDDLLVPQSERTQI